MTESQKAIFEDFFKAIESWGVWMEECLREAKIRLTIAETKPDQAQHDSNLYLDEDGRVWTELGDTWYLIRRASDELYAEYVRTDVFFEGKREKVSGGSVRSVERPDGSVLRFVARSWDDLYWDWGWMIRSPKSWTGSFPTVLSARSSVTTDEAGIALARLLLDQRVEIEAWLVEYATGQGQTRAESFKMVNCDWSAFIEKFASQFKGRDVPDNSSVLCALHETLDRLALGRSRGYWY